jgi:hypothetical protein
MLARMTGLDIVRTYATQSLANVDLAADLARASWIRVLAGRGNELTRDSFADVWRRARRLEYVQILLPDPDVGDGSWLAVREEECSRHDPGFNSGLLEDQIRANVRYLSQATNDDPNVELFLYDLPNIVRLIITDRVAYVTTYRRNAHGRNSPCLVAAHSGPLYELATRMFDVAMLKARRADTAL